MLKLKKGEHLIIRRDKNNFEKKETNYDAPTFLVLKDLEALKNLEANPKYAYFLVSHTTLDKCSNYLTQLPTRYKKRFLLMELEQHQGITLEKIITKEKERSLIEQHNRLLPTLHQEKTLLSYSTGGGVNLIYLLDVEENNNKRKYKKIKREINSVIKENAWSEENTAGIYDGSYHTSVVNMKWLRLPLKDTANPKYGNVFGGLDYNNSAKQITYSELNIKEVKKEATTLDAILQDIYTEQRDLKISSAETKSTYDNMVYLESLGYAIGEANTCIHPNHPDETPSMIVYRNGTAECKSGRVDHHRFSIRDLVEAKGGDIEKVNLYDYHCDNIALHGNEINNDIIRIALRHIERKRMFVLSKDMHSKAQLYNYNQGRWDISSYSDVLYIARQLMSEICKATLGTINSKNFDPKELKDSVTYKNIQRGITFSINNTHAELERTLIATISTNAELKDLCSFNILPQERPWTIPFKNGVFNAVTGRLEKTVAEDYILSKVNVKYKAFSESEYLEIEDLLNEWTGGEGRELATGLARSLSRQESGKIIILIGKGGNGKSVLISNILNKTLISEKSGFTRASTLGLGTLTSEDTFDMVELVGKSVNICNEVQTEHGSLDGLKDKTMGSDYLNIKVKFKTGFNIKPEATFILVGNSIPFIKLDPAMIRRLQIFEFKNDYTNLDSKTVRAFERKIRSTKFKELFFSYLAQIFHKTASGEIIEQSKERVTKLIKKYNNILRTLIEEDYTQSKEDKVSLSTLLRKMEIKAEEMKKGKHWKRETIIRVLGELGYHVNLSQDAVFGLREKVEGETPEPPKGGDMKRKEKGHKNKKSTFASMLKKQPTQAESNFITNFKSTKVEEERPLTLAPKSVFTKIDALLPKEERQRIALDIETTGLIPSQHKISTIQLLDEKEEDFVEVKKYGSGIGYALRNKLQNKAVIGHNISFDFGFLFEHYGIDPIKHNIYILDTMTAAKLDRQADSVADELEKYSHMDLSHYRKTKEGYVKKYGLKDILWFYLQIEMDKEEQSSDWSGELTEAQKEYAMEDVRHLHKLYEVIEQRIHDKGMDLVLKIEEMAAPAIIDANNHTLTIDLEKADKLEEKYELIVKEEVNKYNTIMLGARKEVFESDLDLIKAHRAYKGQKVECTDNKNRKDIASFTDKNGIYLSKSKGAFKFVMSKLLGEEISSTDKYAIEKLKAKHSIFKQIEHMTELIKKYEDIQRLIHNRTDQNRAITRLNQIGAVTGRMSSSALKGNKNKKDNKNKKVGVNMQQVNNASEFRGIFRSPKGKDLILADYSGMELRIVANIAKEETMLEAFRNNEDLHTKTASILFKKDYATMIEVLKDSKHSDYKEYKALRNKSKSINFLITYGGGAKALSEGAGISKNEAKALIESYKQDVYAGLGAYIQQQNNSCTVYSALGRMINSEEIIGHGKYMSILNDSKYSWKAAKYIKRTHGLYSMGQYTNPVNFPIQSTGSDIVKLALALLVKEQDYIKDNVHITHVVHDEIILEVEHSLSKKWQTILQDCMELAGNLVMDNNVYMEAEADIGQTWAEAK